jgi:hypothetical protein
MTGGDHCGIHSLMHPTASLLPPFYRPSNTHSTLKYPRHSQPPPTRKQSRRSRSALRPCHKPSRNRPPLARTSCHLTPSLYPVLVYSPLVIPTTTCRRAGPDSAVLRDQDRQASRAPVLAGEGRRRERQGPGARPNPKQGQAWLCCLALPQLAFHPSACACALHPPSQLPQDPLPSQTRIAGPGHPSYMWCPPLPPTSCNYPPFSPQLLPGGPTRLAYLAPLTTPTTLRTHAPTRSPLVPSPPCTYPHCHQPSPVAPYRLPTADQVDCPTSGGNGIQP